MTLENIYYVGQTIAVFAILGTLIILVIQMRQANRLARSTANQFQIDAMKSGAKMFVDAPDLMDVCLRGNKAPQDLSGTEFGQYVVMRMTLWRTWEGMHQQHLAGMVDPELWEAHLMQAKIALAEPGARAVWALTRPVFTKTFQQFYEAMMPPLPVDATAPAEAGGAPREDQAGTS